MDDLTKFLITLDDLRQLTQRRNPQAVHGKLAGYLAARPPRPCRIECATFDTVYVTSDIHADFRKFVQVLRVNRLLEETEAEAEEEHDDDDDDDDDDDGKVSSPSAWAEDNTEEEAFEKSKTKRHRRQEDEEPVVVNARWTGGSKTLLVILGDIVDGHREHSAPGIDDPKGTFEILIHALIHNLRIRANLANSDVLFTLGNHDVESVLTTVEDERQHMYDSYVHDSAKAFFNNDMNARRNMLLPFYYNSPYTFLEFVHGRGGALSQYVFVHAGIHNSAGRRIDRMWRKVQKKIDSDGLEKMLPVLSLLNKKYKNDIFWTRDYLKSKTCRAIGNERFPMVVVGHCPTPFMAQDDFDDFDDDAGCDVVKQQQSRGAWVSRGRRGCIRVGCRHASTGDPKVVFVDTASSAVFRQPGQENAQRDVEILKLSKSKSVDDGVGGAAFYYKLERQWNDESRRRLSKRRRHGTKSKRSVVVGGGGGTKKSRRRLR
jgi:hypothetical protein